MATTSIGADRGKDAGSGTMKGGTALERYKDAVFMRDDCKFYFGNDGDSSIEYDEDGNDVVSIAGADWRFSDTVKIELGDGGDAYLQFDGTNVILGGTFSVALSDTLPDTTSALFLRSDTGNISDYLLAVRV